MLAFSDWQINNNDCGMAGWRKRSFAGVMSRAGKMARAFLSRAKCSPREPIIADDRRGERGGGAEKEKKASLLDPSS